MSPAESSAVLQARASAHQVYLDRNTTFLTVGKLASRWGCSPGTVRAIPFELLPWINIGAGLIREARRYDPADVAAYEAQQRRRAG